MVCLANAVSVDADGLAKRSLRIIPLRSLNGWTLRSRTLDDVMASGHDGSVEIRTAATPGWRRVLLMEQCLGVNDGYLSDGCLSRVGAISAPQR